MYHLQGIDESIDTLDGLLIRTGCSAGVTIRAPYALRQVTYPTPRMVPMSIAPNVLSIVVGFEAGGVIGGPMWAAEGLGRLYGMGGVS